MPLEIVDGPTIKMGESLSDGVDCTAGTIVRITVPQEYNDGDMPHEMTFQVSSDGNLYEDMVDSNGEPIKVTARPKTAIVIQGYWVHAVGFLKIRSGTVSAPVKQTEDCKLAIALRTEG